MKNNLKIIAVLTVTSMLCGFVLAFVYSRAKEKIEINQYRYIYQGINSIVPEAKNVKEKIVGKKKIFELFDGKGNLVSYAYLCAGNGYQGKIKILFATDKNLNKLLGIEIIESVETPGLGAGINEPDFKNQFKGLNLIHKIECVKHKPQEDYQIEAITSATVSSKAVVRILNEGIKELKSLISSIKQ